MIEISNNFFKIAVNLLGGSLCSIFDKVNNQELLYQKDERSWMGQDVVIFPFVASLKDRIYTVDGKQYSMKNHGLARYYNFKVLEKTLTKVTLEFNSDANTLKEYPYMFHFEISYELIDNKLTIKYKVKNTDTKKIYFSCGGHPALKASGYEYDNGFIYEDTKVLFNNEINTIKYNLNNEGNLITNTSSVTLPKSLILTKQLINKEKTLIYDAKDINTVTLLTNNHKYIFDTSKAQILAIWTMKGYGNYICIEPWWGIPDYENPNLELKDKPLIHKLDSDNEFETEYSITIN